MNKTVSVHLQGIPFVIEESAFELLKNYLDQLTEVLKQEEGANEIKQDIEIRMAELFTKALEPAKKVVETYMVEEVLKRLGDPSVFVNGNETSEPHQPAFNGTEKRLFRDKDKAILGGVCAGFANYFGIDVVIIRALIVLITLFAGFGIPLYIILWIITPKAKTSIEKLQMKGEAVNFESIKMEIEKTAEKIKSNSKHWAEKVKKDRSIQNKAYRVIRFLSIATGIFLLVAGTVLFVTLFLFLFVDPDFIPAQIEGQFMSFGTFGNLILENERDTSNLYWGIIITAASAIGLFWLIGIRLLVTFKSKIFSYSSILFSVLILVGIILLSLTGARIARSFAVNGEVEKEIATVNAQEITLDISTAAASEQDGFKTISKGESGFLKVENGRIFFHGIEVEYQKSADSLFHISQLNSVQGRDHQTALKRARNIQLGHQLVNNELKLDAYFTFPMSDKIRKQEVKLIIQVPANGVVKVKNMVAYPMGEQAANKAEEKPKGYIHSDGSYENW
ncbi:MAG: PspC domain-containing protein [Crocinitomicaceae bacterium]|nr:PspC domain-containing protein [Crocinitomicaceae bacterium]MCF8410500.1 PspC domain-containing protein [Crocinitomicaceae bacterium]